MSTSVKLPLPVSSIPVALRCQSRCNQLVAIIRYYVQNSRSGPVESELTASVISAESAMIEPFGWSETNMLFAALRGPCSRIEGSTRRVSLIRHRLRPLG